MTEQTPATSEKQPADSGTERARTPHSAEFLKYMGEGWAGALGHEVIDTPGGSPAPNQSASAEAAPAEVAAYAAARRARLAEMFPGASLVIHAGSPKTRSNDTEYRFRAHSAFSHLTGWGSATVPESILVIQCTPGGKIAAEALYLRPTAGRGTDEFFANPAIGEFWVGTRPGLDQVAGLLAIATQDLATFNLPAGALQVGSTDDDSTLAEAVSELRLVKDSYEIAEMRKAVSASIEGFENIVRNLPHATGHNRGERLIETAFYAKARELGNDLGYDTIAAAGDHANTLHWIINNGTVAEGQLILVDAGVEVDSLYTADVTRTLPVNGFYSPVQREIYEAVREAADAAFAIAKPGIKFRDIHAEAMKVVARRCFEWGILPAGTTAEDSLLPDNQWHRRWMVHGTSHHLGLDVHDCAQARREMYLDGELKPGMVFTIEPGLYFHADDLMAPAAFRGIGVRIEDDVLVTETGVENLTDALPRTATAVENWMAHLLGR